MSTSALPEIDNPKTTTRIRAVRRFRQKWKRVDYYPTLDVWLKIQKLRELNPKRSINEILDYLVLRAGSAASGTAQR